LPSQNFAVRFSVAIRPRDFGREGISGVTVRGNDRFVELGIVFLDARVR